jgi:sirohydrochlorin cobaltochelatase
VTRGLLLFAHGARDPHWAVPFEDVAARVRAAHPGVPVALAFLEFMTPDLREAGRQLAAQGCTRVDVLPLFLGAGGHVRKDLPELLAELAAAHPRVSWQLHPAVGELDTVIAAMAAAAGQLLRASTDTK